MVDSAQAAGRLLDAAFFNRSSLELAPALLGVELVHRTAEGETAGLIVEVEAYLGVRDRAAHSYGGRRTERTAVMYGPAGHAYIFRIYGMHCCFNIVCNAPGIPEAILVRALQPTAGVALQCRRRGLAWQEGKPVPPAVADGPGKLCQALGITMAQYGAGLFDPESGLFLRHGCDPVPPEKIARGPRVNVDYAGEDRLHPWRFWIRGNPYVSPAGGARRREDALRLSTR